MFLHKLIGFSFSCSLFPSHSLQCLLVVSIPFAKLVGCCFFFLSVDFNLECVLVLVGFQMSTMHTHLHTFKFDEPNCEREKEWKDYKHNGNSNIISSCHLYRLHNIHLFPSHSVSDLRNVKKTIHRRCVFVLIRFRARVYCIPHCRHYWLSLFSYTIYV